MRGWNAGCGMRFYSGFPLGAGKASVIISAVAPCLQSFSLASVLDSSQVSLYLRSNLTQVKAHVTAEQERDTGKDGMGSFQGVSVSHHHCLVILGGCLDPQWSIRRYFCYPYGNNFSEPDYACFFEKLSYHQRPMCSQREFGGP